MGFRAATVDRARRLGLAGWVRNEPDGAVAVHAEGSAKALEALEKFLAHGPAGADVADLEVLRVAVEGHEQFAIRGVAAGRFVIKQHAARTIHFDLRLEVEGSLRSWAVPKGPSLDPAVKRLAVELVDHDLDGLYFEGALGSGSVIVWDRGTYEQGGRLPWPEALQRGHAVFVLHGEKLEGGFALQRTRAADPAQWLLVKRRDEYARPGSDVAAQLPRSVLSGRTLDELRQDGGP